MRVAITGADGFVGKHATRVFRGRGHEVIELVGDATGIAQTQVDVRNPQSLRDALRGVNASHILHLAGASSVARSHENPSEAFTVNTIGTVNLLDAVRHEAPAARVVVVSSGEVYGNLDHDAREDDRTNPTSPYAASKLAAEVAAQQFRGSYGLQVVIARPFNHIGPGQASHFVIPSFATQLQEIKRMGRGELKVGNLDAVRDFSHVLDVVDAYEILLEHGEVGDVYNIASGDGRSVRSLLDEMIRLAEVNVTPSVDKSRLRPIELPRLVGASEKLHAKRWSQTRSVTDALREILRQAQGPT